MAHGPSQRWENGVLVERAIETNRWSVNPDGSPVERDDPDEKAIQQAENKAVAKKDTKNK